MTEQLLLLHELVDAGECTPSCIFALRSSECDCRCRGQYHGVIRGRMEDPYDAPITMVGQFFHTFKDCSTCDSRVVHNQGHIVKELPGERYLVELFSFWDGAPNGRHIEALGEMGTWTFYPNAAAMDRAWEALDRQHEHIDKRGMWE